MSGPNATFLSVNSIEKINKNINKFYSRSTTRFGPLSAKWSVNPFGQNTGEFPSAFIA